MHRRFCRWRDRGLWEKLLEQLVDDLDFEWLLINASHIKVHPHAVGATGGNEAMGRTKGCSTPNCIWPWMQLGMPVRVLVTAGSTADCACADALVEGFPAQHLIADKGYGTNDIVAKAAAQNMHAQIPPRGNPRQQRDYDKHLYKLRLWLKMPFCKSNDDVESPCDTPNARTPYLAAVHIRCLTMWINIS